MERLEYAKEYIYVGVKRTMQYLTVVFAIYDNMQKVTIIPRVTKRP